MGMIYVIDEKGITQQFMRDKLPSIVELNEWIKPGRHVIALPFAPASPVAASIAPLITMMSRRPFQGKTVQLITDGMGVLRPCNEIAEWLTEMHVGGPIVILVDLRFQVNMIGGPEVPDQPLHGGQ